MSVNLTDVSTWEPSVEVPASGDARNAASVVAGFQDLANRTKFLKDKMSQGGSGVNRVQTAATKTILKNLSGMSVGDVCVLLSDFPGCVYMYDTASWAHFTAEPYRVVSNVSGYWYQCNVPEIALLGEGGAAYGSDPPSGSAFDSIGGTSWSTVQHTSSNIAVSWGDYPDWASGDILEAEAQVCVTSDTTYTGYLRLAVLNGGVEVEVPGSVIPIGTHIANTTPVHLSGRLVVAGGYTACDVRLQAKTSNAAGTIYLLEPTMIKARLYREMFA